MKNEEWGGGVELNNGFELKMSTVHVHVHVRVL